MTRKTLKLDGSETFDLLGISAGISPGMDVVLHIYRTDGSDNAVTVTCRIDTLDEIEYVKAGGILQYVLRNMNAG
jgi:aconitate hydratase